MIDALLLLASDPIDAALDYHRAVSSVVREAEQAQIERLEAAESLSRSTRTSAPVGDLPPLLALIRSSESGGNYQAYNPSGCEGWGCGGAYQLHAQYASGWAAAAGFSGLSSAAQTWPPTTQDAVAIHLYYSTNPDGDHWCRWVDYC